LAAAHGFENVFGGGQPEALVHRHGRLPFPGRLVQHKAAFGLYRAAVIDRLPGQFAPFQLDADLVEQCRHIQVGRPVHNHAERTFLVMLADIGQGFGKIGIDHVGHGDQEVVGKVNGLHVGSIVTAWRINHNLA